MDYTDLRHKTAYDFCSNKEAEEWLLDDMEITKEEYLEQAEKDDTFRALGLFDVADYSDNQELMEAVKKEFKKELDDFFEGEEY